jgi:signal transduction histidine kinase/CheY-like chemotaxis protein
MVAPSPLDRIRSEQIRSVYHVSPPGLILATAGCAIFASIVAASGAVSWRIVFIFIAAQVAQVIVRQLVGRSYMRTARPVEEWRRWAAYFCIGSFCGGMIIGVASLWLMPAGHLDMQLVIWTLICGIVSGAVTAYGAYLPALYVSLIPMVGIPLVWMMVQGDWQHYLIAVTIVAWLGANVEQARRYSATIQETVRLRFENEDLVVSLRREKAIAEEASAAKSRFLAAASHDLRQPVHALTLFVAALRPRVSDRQAGSLLDHIESSVRAMGSLFNGLLDISRLDAGVVEVNVHSFAIQPLLARICRDHAGEAQAKGVRLHLKACSVIVRTDPVLLERVVRNIVANAVTYTDRGRVVVGCRRRGAALSVQVWDTGRGIPQAEQEQVFKEFYQVGNPERDRTKGVGLGLAIVKRLTALLDHSLQLRSREDGGTVFTLQVPVSLTAAPVDLGQGDVPAVTEARGVGLILVIDDEAPIQSAMKSLLTDWGYQCIVAGSVEEMVQEIASCPDRPQLIISDYRLRGREDGIRAIEHLRGEYNDDEIPGMLITGDTAPDRLREAQESGLLLLHKPVPNSRLRAAITHLIHRSESSRPASG